MNGAKMRQIVILLLCAALVVTGSPPVSEYDLLASLNEPLKKLTALNDLIAVLTPSKIIVYKLNSSIDFTVDELASVSVKFDESTPINDFRFTAPFELLFCHSTSCQLFNFDPRLNEVILNLEVPLDKIPLDDIASIKAVSDLERVAIQTVQKTEPYNSTITLFDKKTAEIIGTANDYPYSNNQASSLAFTFKWHSFFVGTASRLDNPRNLVEKSSRTHNITNIRITRICNHDKTPNLESKIDISLNCGDSKDKHYKATVATLSADLERLYIVAEDEDKTIANICTFEVDDIMNYFDKTWDACQNMLNPDEIQKKCISNEMSDPLKCNTFSWLARKRYPICQKFNLNDKKETMRNCDLASSPFKAHRYGWIENYLPLNGTFIAKINIRNGNSIKDFVESWDKNSFYLLYFDGNFQRLSIRDTLNHLWAKTAGEITAGLTTSFEPSSKNIIYYSQGNQLRYIQTRCENLYHRCDEISWSDPILCGYCAFSNSTGYVISKHQDEFCHQQEGFFTYEFCPPYIKSVNFGNKVNILGENLRVFDDTIDVLVCGDSCATSHWSNELITCEVGQKIRADCDLEIAGSLNKSGVFKLAQAKLILSSKDDEKRSGMKWLRYVASALAIIIVGGLLICVTVFMKKYQRKRKKKLMSKPHINPYGYKHEEGEGLVELSDYNEFATDTGFLDAHGVPIINQNNFQMREPIGSGNSATVFLGIMTRAGRQTKVAVKKIKYYQQSELEKAMREVQLISDCKHPNIVECIGYSQGSNSYLNVLMEYVPGGDLHTYLINKEMCLVARTAFSYIEQLVKGMQYMATQKIIHRDLAARNCLLSEDYTKLKITDFGLCRRANYDDEYVAQDQTVKLPFRWTAVECMTGEYAFSEKSDIWSFGVVCWEIFSREKMPYNDLHTSEDVYRYLARGNRLLYPASSCPIELYDHIMVKCWDSNPHHRPTFDELAVNLQKLLKELDDIYESALSNAENDGYEKPISIANTSQAQSPSEEPSTSGFAGDNGYSGFHHVIVPGRMNNIYTDQPVSDYQPSTPNGYAGPSFQPKNANF